MDVDIKESGTRPTAEGWMTAWRRSTRERLTNEVARPIVELARQLAPKDLGNFEASIKSKVSVIRPEAILLEIYSDDEEIKAQVIEGVDQNGNETTWGRQPNSRFPPVDIIREWTARKFGLTGTELNRASYLIGRKIALEGIIAVRPIKRAVLAYKPTTDRVIREVIPIDIAQQAT